MSLTLKKRTIVGGIIAASSISTAALAAPTEGFTISPSIGYYDFDSDRDTDNDTAYSLGLGYQFDNPWAVEFTYLNADSEKDGQDVGVDEYRLDGLYHFAEFSNTSITPYLAAGVGIADFSDASDSTNTFVNAGGGLKYAINKALSLRADFRLIKDVEDNHLDNLTSLGVTYTFGTSHDSSSNDDSDAYMQQEPAPVEAQPEPVAEPMPEPVAEPMPEPEPVVVPVHKVDLVVPFATDSAEVQQQYYPEIQKLADYLKAMPSATVVIEGYTDDRGAASYNKALSERRAAAISDVLINTFNVSANRVSSIGYGEERPLMDNDTAANREANRRVVAVVSTNEA
ncbi:OmpA family protein [Marinomonas pollencensis]|uniref:OOP family OmpA-OmpF porin n=1 Tax=Marinomonas pollencensis TaxID=491954 RepID=A0A3E0DPK0_9GAMM|nr:OmpA family protein [Marinomonas pollencensis]REG83775.1 OOP family OmpA-OmpF porin [Marinomonas pollencensis]